MPLADEQFQFRSLVMGPGTDYMINRVEGFEGADVRVSDSDQPRGDGGLRGIDLVAPKTIAIELALVAEGETGAAYEALWAAVREAFRPSREQDFPLVFKRPGQVEKLIRARPVQLVRVEEHKNFNRRGFPPVVLKTVDPRIYSSELHTGNVPIYAASSGGMDWSVGNWPVEYTGGFQTEFVAVNAGTADAYPFVQFFGPVVGTCTGVTLTNSTTGQVLQITTTITTGQILQADMEAAVTGSNRLVISLGGSSRYGSWALPRDPFRLAPGSNNLRFQLTGTSTDVVCNLQWRDTWID